MSSPEAVARNAAAIRALAHRLEIDGHSRPQEAAEEYAAILTSHGFRPLEPPPAPRGPGSSEAGRQAAKRIWLESRPKKGKH